MHGPFVRVRNATSGWWRRAMNNNFGTRAGWGLAGPDLLRGLLFDVENGDSE